MVQLTRLRSMGWMRGGWGCRSRQHVGVEPAKERKKKEKKKRKDKKDKDFLKRLSIKTETGTGRLSHMLFAAWMYRQCSLPWRVVAAQPLQRGDVGKAPSALSASISLSRCDTIVSNKSWRCCRMLRSGLRMYPVSPTWAVWVRG